MSKSIKSIDLVKFIFALFLVIAHYGSEWGRFPTFIDLFLSLYIVIVPFFFVSTGYFLYSSVLCKSENVKGIYLNYIKRILKLYLSWTMIYFIFKMVYWIKNSSSLNDIFTYIHHTIVYSSYPTIWFLPACAIGAFLMYFLLSKFSFKTVGIFAFLLYLFGCLGCSYDFIWKNNIGFEFVEKIYDVYDLIFVTSRNGIFNGFPLMFIGAFLAKQEYTTKFIKRKADIMFLIGSFVLVVIEALIIKVKYGAADVNTTFMMIPFIYLFFRFLLTCEIEVSCNKWMRKMSTLIFVTQRIFLTAIPSIVPGIMTSLCANVYIGLIYVLTSTFLLSAFILLGAKKIKVLRYFI